MEKRNEKKKENVDDFKLKMCKWLWEGKDPHVNFSGNVECS